MTFHIDPDAANFQAFKDLPRDTPIHMLNLLRFRESADYPADHEHAGKGWSGREAYAEYGRASHAIFKRVGGTMAWRGSCQTMVIGPDDKHWDEAFIAAYPTAAAFLEMVTDPDYQRAVANRTAALIDSRLIRFAPGEAGEGFG